MSLDLQQLHSDCQIPQSVRKNWKERTGVDPLAAIEAPWAIFSRWTLRLMGLLFIAPLFVSVRYIVENPNHPGTNIFMITFMVIIGMGCFMCSLADYGSRDKDNAREFAEALDWFLRYGPFTIEVMAERGAKELVIGAERTLFGIADKIKGLEAQGKRTEAEDYKEKHYTPVHAALNQLGLVEGPWDRFFQEESPLEQQSEI